MKFKENWSRGFRKEVVQRCGQTTDGQMREDGWQVITIAHPENPLKFAQVIIWKQKMDGWTHD